MSRRNNTLRKKQLAAAAAFVDAWTTGDLPYLLFAEYNCTLTCAEAETMADLFRVFQYPNTAATIMVDHAEADECGNRHHLCPAWTFDVALTLKGGEYTIVADGYDVEEAEAKARAYMRGLVEENWPGRDVGVILTGADEGAPGETSLYAWIDARDCESRAA
ncbi:hypothetical protein ACFRJ3_34975 [Streptomyces sp. NPDC056696]|uniref:hypothetical protein n=1 Tax=unclassified Streptomyces TaxID=2593676 RepID=UPI003661574B